MTPRLKCSGGRLDEMAGEVCKYCRGEGTWYGMAPHKHVNVKPNNPSSWIGSTVMEDESEWPDNFWPDPETDGMQGVWTCKHCNGTG